MPVFRPLYAVSALAIVGATCCLSPGIHAQELPTAGSSADEQSTGMPKPLTAGQTAAAREAATATLTLLRSSLVSKGRQSLGFGSVAEVDEATVGSPVQETFVRLDRLAAYTPGQPSIAIIQPLGGLVVPVLVRGTVRCGVMLKPNGSAFTGVGVGQPRMTKLITDSVAAVAKAQGVPPTSLVVLRIPALYLTFVARSSNQQTWLTPVSDAPAYSLRAGLEQNAQNVFLGLRSAAQNVHPSGVAAHLQ